MARPTNETVDLDMPPDGSPVGFRHNPDRLRTDDRAATRHVCADLQILGAHADAVARQRGDLETALAALINAVSLHLSDSPEGPSLGKALETAQAALSAAETGTPAPDAFGTCPAKRGVFNCTLPPGHEGDHIAQGAPGQECERWPTPIPAPEEPTP